MSEATPFVTYKTTSEISPLRSPTYSYPWAHNGCDSQSP